jgi:hypothetical protein
MREQAGEQESAVDIRRTAASERGRSVADADRVLADVLAAAHATTVTALRRLDEIEAEVEAVVRDQDTLSLDTASGAHELQRMLLAKQREIIDVVAGAASADTAKRAVLEELLAHYVPTEDPSTA